MSALPPKADMCGALAHVCFVPKADIDVMREPFDQRAFDVPSTTMWLCAEPRALTEEGRYRLLVEAVTDYAIYLLDPSGIVTTWNPGAERFKGYTPHEIIGQHFSQFYTEDDRKDGVPARALETAKREGKFETEGWRVRKDGSRFWVYVIIDPIATQREQLSALPRSPAT